MGNFLFRVWKSFDNVEVVYHLTHTKTGWYIENIVHNGDSDPSGKPKIYDNFRQDHINYSSGFEFLLKSIWEAKQSGKRTDEQTQSKLQELADWVSSCERTKPDWKD
jgi:hypothetical protein